MEASHPEQGTLHAWIEGELDSAEHERIEAHLVECARCREAVAEARGLIAGASRIVAALDGAPAGVVPSQHRFGARRPRFAPARWAAAAAVLLFAATSVVVSREFRSGGLDLAAPAIETAPPSEERLASTPALAPAARAEVPSPTTTSVPAARRSVATAAREPMTTPSIQQARGREVNAGRAAAVEETRRFSLSADTVAAAGRVANEADFAGKGVAGQGAGQIATTVPAIPAPRPSPPAPSVEQAAPPAAQQPMQVRIRGTPSRRVVRVVRYEAKPGVVVTFTEYEELPQRGAARAGAAAPMGAQAEVARPESPMMRSPRSLEGSIFAWRHPDGGRFYTLQGPLSEAELESLARRLGELKVVR